MFGEDGSNIFTVINISKGVNHQVFIRFWQNWSKQELKRYVQRVRNLFILFGIRKNCHSS